MEEVTDTGGKKKKGQQERFEGKKERKQEREKLDSDNASSQLTEHQSRDRAEQGRAGQLLEVRAEMHSSGSGPPNTLLGLPGQGLTYR